MQFQTPYQQIASNLVLRFIFNVRIEYNLTIQFLGKSKSVNWLSRLNSGETKPELHFLMNISKYNEAVMNHEVHFSV